MCQRKTEYRMSWQPDHLSPKQKKILDNRSKFLLLTGPRKSGKSVGGVNAIAWHLWRVKRAWVSMVSTTQTVAYDGGTWTDLTNEIEEKWIAGDFGMKWVTKPRMDGVTHKIFFEVSNAHGGVSRCQLDSLDDEKQAETKFKQKKFTMVYMAELSNFKLRATFDMLMETLRSSYVADEDLQLIGDTNPADDGEDSWIYKLWYVFPRLDDAGLRAYIRGAFPDIEDDALETDLAANRLLQKQFNKLEFTLDDNVWMTPAQKAVQKAKYAHNRDTYDRYVKGLWKKASTEGMFSTLWRPNFFIMGEKESPTTPDPIILLPTEKCWQLNGGWDYGDKNKAAVFGEKWMRQKKDKEQGQMESVFNILGESIIIGEKSSLSDFVITKVEVEMDFLEAQCDSPVQWRHFSDRSSFEAYNSVSDSYEWLEISNASNGRITLTPSAKKGDGSVQLRVDLLTKLLFHERIFVSARCVKLIEMFGAIKEGKTTAIEPGSKFKHAFDALTYWLIMELWDELLIDEFARTGKAQKASGSGIISMDL